MRRQTTRPVALLLTVSIAIAACSTLNPAPSTSSTPGAVSAAPVATDSGLATEPETSDHSPDVGASAMTQTDTDWGRIWDAIPRSFPVYPGASETTEIGSPASAQLIIPTDVATGAAWMKGALDAKGLRTTVSGPLEDGSMMLDSVGPSGCAAKTTIGRTGTVTVMTVLYGANCPFS